MIGLGLGMTGATAKSQADVPSAALSADIRLGGLSFVNALANGPEPAPNSEANGTLIRGFVGETAAKTQTATAQRAIVTYTVASGDTLFGIAGDYGVSPESILWSNYKTLRDNPDLLSVGQELLIPPANGVIVPVEAGDTVAAIARQMRVTESALIAEPLNRLRGAGQALAAGDLIFAPGGQRETIVWQLPKPVEVRVNASGVSVYRVGVCGEIAIPRLGTNAYVYPVNTRYLSGYNYSAWHPGLDFAGRLGDPIYAADSGTVIYAGYSLSPAGLPVGYGQYVVVDHGNGYQTLYAHASQLFVRCGQQVARGAQIAAVGSVGKSTGPHLHFELRLGGTALNPWSRLPPP